MIKENYKVPFAVLSCFLITFILQGILKLCGIFVFEKALDWQIFGIIDNTLWLQIIYYSLAVIIICYCLSFSLTDKFYSKKWYHYLIIVLCSVGVTTLRLMLTTLSFPIQILLDILIYVVVPSVVYFTTPKENRMIGNGLFGVVVSIAFHIMLYFIYLGLNYWSGVLSSFIFIKPEYANSVSLFLVKLEVYFALFSFLLSTNIIVKVIKRRNTDMQLPVDIASEEAKAKALKERAEKKNAKLKK